MMDSGAAFTSVMNPRSLDNMANTSRMLTIAGDKVSSQHGNSGSVKWKAWEDTTGAANVASLADSVDQCHVKFDDAIEDVFTLDVKSEQMIEFPHN